MSQKHEIDGGWVLLRDPSEVTERGRRKVRNVMFELAAVPGMDKIFDLAQADGNTPDAVKRNVEANEGLIASQLGDGMSLIDQMQDASIMARLKEWSFLDENGGALPLVADSLLDLPGGAYDALKELCKDLPMGLDLEPSPDPKAPMPSITV